MAKDCTRVGCEPHHCYPGLRGYGPEEGDDHVNHSKRALAFDQVELKEHGGRYTGAPFLRLPAQLVWFGPTRPLLPQYNRTSPILAHKVKRIR